MAETNKELKELNEITIIGAGPIGSYLTYLLAKKGKKVSVYEEHKEVGLPVQCSGIVTNSVKNFFDFSIEPAVKNYIYKIEVFSKHQKTEFNLKMPDVVLDREKFDKKIYEKAMEVGAKFHLNSRLLAIERKKNIIELKIQQDKKIITIYTRILIGADGPMSKVAKFIGKNNKTISAIQAVVKTRNPVENKVKVFLKPKTFMWVIPESPTMLRVGMAGRNAFELIYFAKSIGEIMRYQSGQVPLFYNGKISKENIFLVGDAASQIKETTFGGIVPGLRGAQALANAIIRHKDYGNELKKLNKELRLHKKMRKVLNKMKEEDYDFIVKSADKKKVKDIFNKISRDNLKKIAPKIFFAEPKLLSLARFLF